MSARSAVNDFNTSSAPGFCLSNATTVARDRVAIASINAATPDADCSAAATRPECVRGLAIADTTTA
jgi:hypothetical protein